MNAPLMDWQWPEMTQVDSLSDKSHILLSPNAKPKPKFQA